MGLLTIMIFFCVSLPWLISYRFMRRSLWKSKTLVSGSVMIRGLERTTCTRNSVTLAVQMLSRVCIRIWPPGIVLASARFTYAHFSKNIIIMSSAYTPWPDYLCRFSEWLRSRRQTIFAVLTSNNSLLLTWSSPFLIVSPNIVRNLLPTALPHFKGRLSGVELNLDNASLFTMCIW